MRSFLRTLLAGAALAVPTVATADTIDLVNVFAIGDTRSGPVTVSWTHFFAGPSLPSTATLAIVAEGVDDNLAGLKEIDQVVFNGHSLGILTGQNFYNPSFDIQPGPGALGFPRTELTTTLFHLPPGLLRRGQNSVNVVVDPSNWIMEVETSRLTTAATPEPTSVLLLGFGVAGMALRRRRQRHQRA